MNKDVKEAIIEYQNNFGSIEESVALQMQLDLATEEFEEVGPKINNLKKQYEEKYAKATQGFLEKKLQVSVLKIMVAGEPEIAKLKEKIRNLEHRKDYLNEEINRLKLKIRVNEGQINREWYQAGNSR